MVLRKFLNDGTKKDSTVTALKKFHNNWTKSLKKVL